VLDPVWLLLLLPLAAASGWLAGRRDNRLKHPRGGGDIPSEYFQGLNFLLNEQPDKAIEVFIKVLEVDSETVETHLMLGSLFRRRGEIERATRIHQNLIARPNLDREQRSQALYELAQDYLKAGLLDRAENLLLEYAEVQRQSEPALRHLLYIYQQEKEWDQAIITAKRLARVSGRSTDAMIAHFYCEKAEEAITAGETGKAEDLLGQALATDRNSVRANILHGRIARAAGDCSRAIKYWLKIDRQDRQYLPEILDALAECYKLEYGQAEWENWLRRALGQAHSIPLMLRLAREIESRHGVDQSREFIVEELRLRPSLHGLIYLIRLTGEQTSGQARSDMQTLQAMLEQVLTQRKRYLCEHCGFRGQSLHWQCPGCRRWNSMKPVWEEAGE